MSIRSPGCSVTIAFFQAASCPTMRPPRLLAARDLAFFFTFNVLTALTRTLNVASTAALIWILFASVATSKLYCPVSMSIVFFSVINGRLMMSSCRSSATLGPLFRFSLSSAGGRSRLLPRARLAAVCRQRQHPVDRVQGILANHQAFVLQDVADVQIGRQYGSHVLQVAGAALDDLDLIGCHNQIRPRLRKVLDDCLHGLGFRLELSQAGDHRDSLVSQLR